MNIRNPIAFLLSCALFALTIHPIAQAEIEQGRSRTESPVAGERFVHNIWLDTGPSLAGSLAAGRFLAIPLLGVDFKTSHQWTIGPVAGLMHGASSGTIVYSGTSSPVSESTLAIITGASFRWFALSSAQQRGAFLKLMTGLVWSRNYRWSADGAYNEGSSLGAFVAQSLSLGYQWHFSNGITLSPDLGLLIQVPLAMPRFVGSSPSPNQGLGLQLVPMIGLSVGFAP